MIEKRYHRHLQKWRTFIETLNDIAEERSIEYQYCEICKCTPTTMLGEEIRDEEAQSDPRRHGQAANEEVEQSQASPAEDGAAE